MRFSKKNRGRIRIPSLFLPQNAGFMTVFWQWENRSVRKSNAANAPLPESDFKIGTWDKKSKSTNFFEIRLILFLVKNNLRKYQFYLFMINSLFVFNFKSLKINVLSFFVNAIVNSVPKFRFGFSPSKRKINRKRASVVSKQFNFKAWL